MAKIKNGGFSKEVYEAKKFSEYVSEEYYFGWLGHAARTKALDIIVEEEFTAMGLGPAAIASWMTSASARHMGDAIENCSGIDYLMREVIQNMAKGAFKDIVVWSYPDHQGILDSSIEIWDKITKIVLEEQARKQKVVK